MKNNTLKRIVVTSFFLLAMGSIASLWLPGGTANAAEEVCASCSRRLSITGDFTHRTEPASTTIQGAEDNAAAFREDINGTNFTVSVSSLPEGRYTIVMGFVETQVTEPGLRLFTVKSGDATLAGSFDIVAEAGGVYKVCYLRSEVEHLDDSLRGPLQVSFTAIKESAKLNTLEILDSSGASVLTFSAMELADPFSEEAARIPDIAEAPIWRDPDHSLRERADDLIRRMSLEEKVAQLRNDAPAIAAGTSGVQLLE